MTIIRKKNILDHEPKLDVDLLLWVRGELKYICVTLDNEVENKLER